MMPFAMGRRSTPRVSKSGQCSFRNALVTRLASAFLDLLAIAMSCCRRSFSSCLRIPSATCSGVFFGFAAVGFCAGFCGAFAFGCTFALLVVRSAGCGSDFAAFSGGT